jgi:hypothetical protein
MSERPVGNGTPSAAARTGVAVVVTLGVAVVWVLLAVWRAQRPSG